MPGKQTEDFVADFHFVMEDTKQDSSQRYTVKRQETIVIVATWKNTICM